MADILLYTIIVKYDALAGQWCAHFDGTPQVAFGSDVPMGALRRLLEGAETPPGEYELHCDQDQTGSGELMRVATWQPPDILFPCSTCNGTGQYIGFLDAGICKACGGRKVVKD